LSSRKHILPHVCGEARAGPETAYVFISERLAPMTAATFRKLLARAGDAANLGMPIHPHMLRHSTGLNSPMTVRTPAPSSTISGNRNIQHTVLYTQLASDRFKD
jgi:type 1 fimbriae regulatory protein FimB/type 1 fimbriae regulatory protein FimE